MTFSWELLKLSCLLWNLIEILELLVLRQSSKLANNIANDHLVYKQIYVASTGMGLSDSNVPLDVRFKCIIVDLRKAHK
jgi:hypothetical protein